MVEGFAGEDCPDVLCGEEDVLSLGRVDFEEVFVIGEEGGLVFFHEGFNASPLLVSVFGEEFLVLLEEPVGLSRREDVEFAVDVLNEDEFVAFGIDGDSVVEFRSGLDFFGFFAHMFVGVVVYCDGRCLLWLLFRFELVEGKSELYEWK